MVTSPMWLLQIYLCFSVAASSPVSAQKKPTHVVTAKGAWTAEIQFKPTNLSRQEAGNVWGTLPGDRVCEVVDRIEVRHHERSVPIPPSAWAGLSRTQRFQVRFDVSRPKVVRLVISAGDAGTSYGGIIEISGGQVIRRRIWLGEFPNNYWEETRYVARPLIEER